eukprot:3076940-Rhodomonas_salina.2
MADKRSESRTSVCASESIGPGDKLQDGSTPTLRLLCTGVDLETGCGVAQQSSSRQTELDQDHEPRNCTPEKVV